MNDGSRTYNLCAVSAEERDDWCYHIDAVCESSEEQDSKPPPPPVDQNEFHEHNDEHNEGNNATGYPEDEDGFDEPRSRNANNRINNAANDNQVEDRGYTDTDIRSLPIDRKAPEKEEDDTLVFFLALLGSERKFQVAMPEIEAEELTIREIKENFAGTLQAQVEDIVISIGGEVLRNDIKGHEFGLADGTELEVSISNEQELKSETTLSNRDSNVSEKDAMDNSQLHESPKPRGPPPPAPLAKDDSELLSAPTYSDTSYRSSNDSASAKYGVKRPSFVPPVPPTSNSNLFAESRQPLGQSHTEKINLEVVDKGDVELFSISSDKGQRAELGIRQFCKINNLNFENVGPTIMQHMKTMTRVNGDETNTAETKPDQPVSPQVRKELSLALLSNQSLKRKCNELESQLKSLENSVKEKHLLEQKCKTFEDQIKNLKSDLESAETSASQAHGVVNVNLVNERRRHRQNVEALKKSHEQEKISLEKKHEDEVGQLRKQVALLGTKLEEQAKATNASALKPETPDEKVIMLQEEVTTLRKRLKAARTLSSIERNDVEVEALYESFSSPASKYNVNHLDSMRSPDLTRGQWRQFMEEKRNIIARSNRDREKLMLENQRLRKLLSHEQGLHQRHQDYHLALN